MSKFVCQSCGGALYYDAKKQNLSCQTCQSQEPIEVVQESLHERPLEASLDAAQNYTLEPLQAQQTHQVVCPQCGGFNDWDYDTQGDICQYCKTPIIEDDEKFKTLNVDGVLAFTIDEKFAEKVFRDWVKNRWFAPNDLKSMGGHGKQFKGVYLPH